MIVYTIESFIYLVVVVVVVKKVGIMIPIQALKARKRQGMFREVKLMDFVEDHEGLSYYEIAKKLGWDVSLVRYFAKKLEVKGLVEIKTSVEESKVTKRVYPKEVKYVDLINKEWWDKESMDLFKKWDEEKKSFEF